MSFSRPGEMVHLAERDPTAYVCVTRAETFQPQKRHRPSKDYPYTTSYLVMVSVNGHVVAELTADTKREALAKFISEVPPDMPQGAGGSAGMDFTSLQQSIDRELSKVNPAAWAELYYLFGKRTCRLVVCWPEGDNRRPSRVEMKLSADPNRAWAVFMSQVLPKVPRTMAA